MNQVAPNPEPKEEDVDTISTTNDTTKTGNIAEEGNDDSSKTANAPSALEMKRQDDDKAAEAEMEGASMTDVLTTNSSLAKVFEIACFPLMFLPSWWIQRPREESIILHFGVVTDQVKSEGCHYHPIIGREIRTIPTVQFCTSIPKQKVTDSRGNPIYTSAVITYRFVNPTQALLNVQSPHEYVTTQAMGVLKSVVSKFSYEELKSETEKINKMILRKLQPKVSTAGAVILSALLDNLNYAPEIAQHMLKQQQARALIEARHLLVNGSVGISTDAVKDLEKVGVPITDEDKARLVSSIVLITSSDTHANLILPL